MNMKYFNKILAIGLLLCAGLSSCEMKDEIKGGKNGNSDFGYLELGVGVSAKTNQSSRAEVETVSADEFPVEINGVTASDYKKTFNTYAELKAQGKIELPVGSYIVKAHTPGDIKPQMDAPYYYGEASNLIITKYVTSEVTVTCTMKNTKISLKYTEKFLKSLTSWTITVTDGTSNILSYDNTNTTPSPKYWWIADKVSDIKVHIDGVNVQGSKVSEDRIITKPSGAASEYWGGNDDLTITMDINEELYRYRKIIYTLEQDYRILTNIYNNLLNNKRVLTKTILINNKIFSLEEYNNILNEISITRENIRITLQNIRIEYNTLLEGN